MAEGAGALNSVLVRIVALVIGFIVGLIVTAVVLFVALFIAGFLWPRPFSPLQRRVSRLLGKGEAMVDRGSVSGQLTRGFLPRRDTAPTRAPQRGRAVAIKPRKGSLPREDDGNGASGGMRSCPQRESLYSGRLRDLSSSSADLNNLNADTKVCSPGYSSASADSHRKDARSRTSASFRASLISASIATILSVWAPASSSAFVYVLTRRQLLS